MASRIMAATQPNDTQKTTPRPERWALAATAGSWTPFSSSYSRIRSMAPKPPAGVPRVSTTAHPRIEEGEQDVHAEVDDDVGDGGHQGHSLDDQVVARIDGGDELEADPGELEQDLHHEGPGEQRPDAETGPGQEGERRGSQCVADEDVGRGQALGP